MTAREIARRLAERAEETCRHLLPNGRRVGNCWCAGSTGGEAGDSLKVHLSGSMQGVWADFAGGPDDRGDLIGLWKKARGVDLGTACEQALDWLEVPAEQRNDRSHQPPPPKRIETRPPSESWLRLQKRMRPGTAGELIDLAALRKIPATAGLVHATEAGHLWFGDVHDDGFDWPAWILTDGSRRNAQARKMDGTPWAGIKGAKAKTITGCQASWPVGISEVGAKQEIWLVEGGPDLLAAWHLAWLTAKARIVAPVAIFGASNSIHPEALPLFKGKDVRIFAHNEPSMAGMNAGIRWRRELLDAGARAANFFSLKEDGCKDLNEYVAAYGIPELREVV